MRLILFPHLTLDAPVLCHGVDLRPLEGQAAVYIPTHDKAERTAAERRLGLLRGHLSYIAYRLGYPQTLLDEVNLDAEAAPVAACAGETRSFAALAKHLPDDLEPAGITLAFFARYLASDDPKWRTSMFYQAFSALYGGPEALISQVANLSSQESVAALLAYTAAIRLAETQEGEVEPEAPPEEVFVTMEKVYMRSLANHCPELKL